MCAAQNLDTSAAPLTAATWLRLFFLGFLSALYGIFSLFARSTPADVDYTLNFVVNIPFFRCLQLLCASFFRWTLPVCCPSMRVNACAHKYIYFQQTVQRRVWQGSCEDKQQKQIGSVAIAKKIQLPHGCTGFSAAYISLFAAVVVDLIE